MDSWIDSNLCYNSASVTRIIHMTLITCKKYESKFLKRKLLVKRAFAFIFLKNIPNNLPINYINLDSQWVNLSSTASPANCVELLDFVRMINEKWYESIVLITFRLWMESIFFVLFVKSYSDFLCCELLFVSSHFSIRLSALFLISRSHHSRGSHKW